MKKSLYRQEFRALMELSLPIVISQLGTVAMGVADTIQVGQIPNKSAAAIAATSIANCIFFMICIIGLFGLSVVAPMISKAAATNDQSEIKALHHGNLQVAWLLGIVCTIICFSLSEFLPYLGQDPEVVALAIPYGRIISLSTIPMFLFTALRQRSDGLGFTQVAMYVTLSALVLNVALNHLLIHGVWLFPRLELNGAGIATLVSRTYIALALWAYTRRKSELQPYRISDIRVRILEKSPHFKHILTIGVTSGLQGFFEVAIFTAAVVMIGRYGKYQQAAHQVALNLSSVSYMMITGIATAGSIRVGHFFGLRDIQGMSIAGTAALLFSVGLMSCSATLFFVIPDFFIGLYSPESAVVPIAVKLLTIGALFQLSDGIQATGLGILRGISDVNVPTILGIFAYWGVGLPLGWFFAEYWNLQSRGVWIGLTLALTTLAILLVVRFYQQIRAKF
jgi:MATE family multidrug resistance protein